MKTLLRIPTNEQYAYIEVEFEGTPEEAMDEYRRLTIAVKGNGEMETKEFNELIDEYLTTKKISDGADRYSALGTSKVFSQQDVVQIIKRSHARTKND